MTDNDDCRKAFEEDHTEHIGRRNYARDAGGDYVDGISQGRWNLYRAACTRRLTGQVDFEKVVRGWYSAHEHRFTVSIWDTVDNLILRLKTAVPTESVNAELVEDWFDFVNKNALSMLGSHALAERLTKLFNPRIFEKGSVIGHEVVYIRKQAAAEVEGK